MVALVAGGLTAAALGPEPDRLRPLPASVKVLAALAFVLGSSSPPPTAIAVFVLDAVAVGVVAHLAGLRPPALVRRLAIEVPFLAFAAACPRGRRAAGRPRAAVLSVPGLWAAWGIVAKGALGVAVAVVLVDRDPVPTCSTASAGSGCRRRCALHRRVRGCATAAAAGDDLEPPPDRPGRGATTPLALAGSAPWPGPPARPSCAASGAVSGSRSPWPPGVRRPLAGRRTARSGAVAASGPLTWAPAAAFAAVAVAGAAAALTGVA